EAEKEFLHFIEKTGIPAASTLLGLGAIPTDHPLYVGLLGMHGNYAPNIMTNECDVLIAIGMRFDDRVTGRLDKYAKQAKIIHLDIDPAEINKNVKTDVEVWGDCKETLPALSVFVNNNTHSEWVAQFQELYKTEYQQVIEADLYGNSEEISMGEVLD